MEIAKAYDPKEAEENHYQRWESEGFFAPEINENPNAKKYSIVIPPPNVTGSLHMGHALQHTIMDVLTRRKRMQGYRTLWLPGTDHAGISVQRKVVEQLKKEEDKKPTDIGREEFVRRAWTWKEQYGNTITEQMRREGASVDWTRQRFTMDESLSTAVRNVFCTLYEEGWIYKGLRIVNWCPKDKTVLSDLEVKEEAKKDGKLYYLRYPLAEPPASAGGQDSTDTYVDLDSGALPPAHASGSAFVIVATTRPETMLGDTAVAVNPKDERYKDLIGKTILLPLTDREITIVGDEYVDAEFGTGAVKITPAHDPNDYQVGERHNLPRLLVMNEDATMNASTGPDFEGLDRFVARAKVVERFEELGLLEKVDDYEITLPVCERCKTIVEPILSDQWFVKMNDSQRPGEGMRDMALDLMRSEGVPHFSPQVPHEKVYTAWLENLKDWTISRQLWWGHQIPAWYDSEGNVYVARSAEEAKEQAGGKNLTQDSDVLDTWFSSGLWAFSTLGWNGDVTDTPDLEKFLPTDVLVTGRDIIFLWVSRMIMLTKKFTGKKAFEDVIVTGTVLGKDGKPMSKSRNNGVDPIDMFDKFGVDATRIYLASIATGADIKWNDRQIETYRNFANKIWNATRFCLMHAGDAKVDPASLEIHISAKDESGFSGWERIFGSVDGWILARLKDTANEVDRTLSRYQFHLAVDAVYQFFWHDFCDWYIELVKDEVSVANNSEEAMLARAKLLTVLEQALRLLHPFMPFITEELWQRLPGTSNTFHNDAYQNASKTIVLCDLSKAQVIVDENERRAEKGVTFVIDLISKVRRIRSESGIKYSENLELHVRSNAEIQLVCEINRARIEKLARGTLHLSGPTIKIPPKPAIEVLIGGADLYVPIGDFVDINIEIDRQNGILEKLGKERDSIVKQLENPEFVDKAAPETVAERRNRQLEIKSELARRIGMVDLLNK